MKYNNDKAEIINILERVEASVHKKDYEGVRDLIPDDGVYYGSVASVARGYEELREKQFARVWPNIGAFRILRESLAIHTSEDLAWAICLFESSSAGVDGAPLQRKGRMTFIFTRREGKWIMLHSHDSLYPAVPDRTD